MLGLEAQHGTPGGARTCQPSALQAALWLTCRPVLADEREMLSVLCPALCRALGLVLIAIAAADGLSAQLKGFPWVNRSDPKINADVFVDAPRFKLACKEVGVFPFSGPDQGEPQAFAFATFLRQALLMQGAAETIADIPSLPWDDMPAWKLRELTDAEKISAVAKDGDARRLDLVVLGSVDSLFRKPSGGLEARVTILVVDTSDGKILWYGTRQAAWIRYFPTEECLLHIAWSFVDGWAGSGR